LQPPVAAEKAPCVGHRHHKGTDGTEQKRVPGQRPAHVAQPDHQKKDKDQRREEEQRMERHRKGRRRAAAILVVTLVLAGLSFLLLYRQAQVETLIIDQNNIRSSIKSVTKQLEELQVQLNMKGDIGQIQEYAREQLSMDYPTSENTRTIVLP